MLVIIIQHDFPDVKVKQIEVWGIGWPVTFVDKVRAVELQEFLSPICTVCWCSILLEGKVISQQLIATLQQSRQQLGHIALSVHFGLFRNKVQMTISTVTNPC